MKKVLTVLLSAALIVAMALSLTACSKSEKVKVIDIELTEEDYAFAIQKGNTALLDEVNAYLAESKASGALNTLINSYFNGEATFSYKNKTNTPATGDFVVATNAYFPPFESYNDDSAFYGVDIEIAYNIAQRLGKNLFIKDMDFDGIIDDVKNGDSDIGMAGITVDDTRKIKVDFADGYYTSAQVIVVREGDTTFDGCTSVEDVEAILKAKTSSYIIGTQAGTTGYMYSHGDEDFGYEGFGVNTKAYNTGALAMTDLSNGKINAVILDKQPALMIAKKINKK
ncbi:MAG: transporter substrate-binding domain-containing protein [Clostridiales bacterium]|nr:transporter substrate-binding domain-containing protein [Clostridiales bacterium]